MGKYTGVLIASDIDGTFLGRHSRQIPENIAAIEKFKAGGGLFTFATGRAQDNMLAVIPNAAEIVNAPVIQCNGTSLYDCAKDEISDEVFLDGEKAKEALEYALTICPDAGVRVSCRRGFITNRLTPQIERDLSSCGMRFAMIAPFEEWKTDDFYKVVVRHTEPEKLDMICAAIYEKFGDMFEYSMSGRTLLEFQAAGCNKGNALVRLKEKLADEGKNVRAYAAGDYENDLKLLAAADVACCPANALQCVKDVCAHCLCSNDEGMIAQLIKKIGNGEF